MMNIEQIWNRNKSTMNFISWNEYGRNSILAQNEIYYELKKERNMINKNNTTIFVSKTMNINKATCVCADRFVWRQSLCQPIGRISKNVTALLLNAFPCHSVIGTFWKKLIKIIWICIVKVNISLKLFN